MKAALALFMVVALSTSVNESALARGSSHGHSHGSHARSRAFVGGTIFWGGYYYPPPYYYSRGVATPYPPRGYIEQGNDTYYCGETASYYPDVSECPGGWLQLTPVPVPPS